MQTVPVHGRTHIALKISETRAACVSLILHYKYVISNNFVMLINNNEYDVSISNENKHLRPNID